MADVLEILKRVGAILTDDHFVGTSGRHMPVYINKDALYPHTNETAEICRQLALAHRGRIIDAVASPVLGGVILSQWTAYHLAALYGEDVAAVYVEKTAHGGLAFTRGYDKLVMSRNVLAVEDTVATGGSLKKLIAAVRDAGGTVSAAAVIVNRIPREITSATLGVPFQALVDFPVPTYDASDCPLCARGIPVNIAVGHGAKFMEEKGLEKQQRRAEK